MVVIRELKNTTQWERPLFVAIGCFDGIHLAHQKILKTVIAGKEQGMIPAVFTFDVNPDCGGKGMPILLPTEEKIRILEELGIEIVFMVNFADVKGISAQEFVKTTLYQQCGAKKVCCGYNFHFGKGGTANADVLRQLCAEEEIEVVVIEEMDILDQPISSTRIRKLIQEGKIEEANRLLGRPFSFIFPIIHGRKLGRKMGIPTMNQQIPTDFIQPKNGVYCSETILDGKSYCSVTNIGVKPTVGSDGVSAETWIQDFDGDLYGKSVRVLLHTFLREEKKFPSLDALREQILLDRSMAKQRYEEIHGK